MMAPSFQGFKSLIENSPNAISLINVRGEILYGSASTAKILGYPPEELVGRNCLDLIHPEDRDQAGRTLRAVLAKPPEPLRWEARVHQKNGNYCWVESIVSNLLFESDVKAIVVQQRDINARKTAEVEMQRQHEELARSNRRLEEFAYTAAHDLREPLRTISLFTTLLARETQLDANGKQIAGFIEAGVARLSALVRDLLAFATTGRSEPRQTVYLRHAITQATQNLALEIKESGAIVTIDPMPVVLGNETHLVRLFQNLIGNAVKYRAERTAEIRVTAVRSGPEWVIRIADNGIGIAPEDRDRVFQPFVRLMNRDVAGTGLGLAVCKNIVEGLGGTIQVESALGAGSTFSFTIAAPFEGGPECDADESGAQSENHCVPIVSR